MPTPDLKAESRAPLAYARIRGNVRPDSKPMPHWDDLQPTERKLLEMMWYLGCEDGLAALKSAMDETGN